MNQAKSEEEKQERQEARMLMEGKAAPPPKKKKKKNLRSLNKAYLGAAKVNKAIENESCDNACN